MIIPGRGGHIHDDVVQRRRLGDLPMQTRCGRGRRHCRQVDTDVANRSVKVVLRGFALINIIVLLNMLLHAKTHLIHIPLCAYNTCLENIIQI